MAIRLTKIEEALSLVQTIQRYESVHERPMNPATLVMRLEMIENILRMECERTKKGGK